jgi:hypothetical protein
MFGFIIETVSCHGNNFSRNIISYIHHGNASVVIPVVYEKIFVDVLLGVAE